MMAFKLCSLLWKPQLQHLHKHLKLSPKLCLFQTLNQNLKERTSTVRNLHGFVKSCDKNKTFKLFSKQNVFATFLCLDRQQKLFLLGGFRQLSNSPKTKGPRIVLQGVPLAQGPGPQSSDEKLTALFYTVAFVLFMGGVSYAAVPLYRVFCQTTGRGGSATIGGTVDKVETMEVVEDRIIKVRFNADIDSNLRWNFRPQQAEIQVRPGETALAFYTAKNPTTKPIIGISTYTVVPFEAGYYFNKIQCFCFEEQRLNPNEQVDMPVFFYIDPDFMEDPRMENVESIVLSYTFFEAKDGLTLPYPGFAQQTQKA